MREILFRGKRKDNREWETGSLVMIIQGLSDEQVFITDNLTGVRIPVSPDTIGQYTGITDKAGTKAFEHDCIRQLRGDAIGVIRYGKCNNAFDGYELPYHVGFFVDWVSGEDKDILRKDLGYWLKLVEVIGNIHDNKSLLNIRRQESRTIEITTKDAIDWF